MRLLCVDQVEFSGDAGRALPASTAAGPTGTAASLVTAAAAAGRSTAGAGATSGDTV